MTTLQVPVASNDSSPQAHKLRPLLHPEYPSERNRDATATVGVSAELQATELGPLSSHGGEDSSTPANAAALYSSNTLAVH